MADLDTADDLDMLEWARAERFDDFALMCCRKPHLSLLSDPDQFSVTQRAGRVGPVLLSEILVGSDLSMACGDMCDAYRVLVLVTGHTECVHRGVSVSAGPGSAAVFAPEGLSAARWEAGSRIVCFKIDRRTVNDALSDALGRQVMSRVDFTPIMPITAAPTRSWINMLLLFKEQLFRPDSLINQPLVGLPFVDSLVRGFLLAAHHSHRYFLTTGERLAAPRTFRKAVEIIEEEAHLPLTVSSIAARCGVSVRSLQQDFRRHMGASPMAYLREVRLRRAHQSLLESDPSTTSVASIAYHWGFTNLGRFAAAHTARYDEPLAVTLRSKAFRRSRANRGWIETRS